MSSLEWILFDAGLFIGALLGGDSRHSEAKPLVEAGRRGDIAVCTTAGILSEVYAALTWAGADPPHAPREAARAVRLLVTAPSPIRVLESNLRVAESKLQLAERHTLTARRTHDARHAAAALASGVTRVYTYDVSDWRTFATDGVRIAGPPSVMTVAGRSVS